MKRAMEIDQPPPVRRQINFAVPEVEGEGNLGFVQRAVIRPDVPVCAEPEEYTLYVPMEVDG